MAALSILEAAQIAGLSPEILRDYARAGRLKARRIGRVYIVERRDLDRFLAIPRPMGRPRKKQGS